MGLKIGKKKKNREKFQQSIGSSFRLKQIQNFFKNRVEMASNFGLRDAVFSSLN